MFSGEAANINFIVFGLIWPELEPVIITLKVNTGLLAPKDLLFGFSTF